MKATFELTQMEVGCTRNGRPSYRWTTGYYVIKPDGSKLYPPMSRSDAIAYCRREGWDWSAIRKAKYK